MASAFPTETLSEGVLNRAIVLKNRTCVYCGTYFDGTDHTKEHVIGRRFVPKGKLHDQWNLIVRACMSCNSRKANLEDDISAISMHPDAWGRCADANNDLTTSAYRKAAKSISRKTGKLVGESVEKLSAKIPFAPGGIM